MAIIQKVIIHFLSLAPTASALGPGVTAVDPGSLSNQLKNATWVMGSEPNLSPRAVPTDASVPVSVRATTDPPTARMNPLTADAVNLSALGVIPKFSELLMEFPC